MNISLLIAAMIAVESGGDDTAIGDNGRSIGALQISRQCVVDVNRFSGSKYRWPRDCYSRATSVEICTKYLTHYCGNNASPEVYARTWNGGPDGSTRKSTMRYWRSVHSRLTPQ